MTGVRKGEEQVSIPLRRDRSWACGHVLMEERFDRSTVQPYRAQRISWAHEAWGGRVGRTCPNGHMKDMEERFDLVAAQHG